MKKSRAVQLLIIGKSMSDIDTLLKLVQYDIERIDTTMLTDLEQLGDKLDQRLLEILNYGLFGGGKRFRPLLAIISSRLCGGRADTIYELATAFEYLHMATLFHDDVIDRAETRRGKPSVCKAYGIAAAVLAGDFLHARSMEIIGRHGGGPALQIFCRATTAMVDGEFIQLRNAENFNQSEEDYFKAIEGKTALLISAATEIGALYGGADPGQQQALKEYGRNLGYGFQIVDDLLDYRGEERTTGKKTGNDLAEGKMTLPLIFAIEQADHNERSRLLEILAAPDLRQKSFDTIIGFIQKYDGFSLAANRAERCIAEALHHLEIFASGGMDKEIQILTGLAQYALQRKK
jgi:octaprenyl-diphosphate synthase